MRARYAGRTAVLLTQHGKEKVIGPVLAESCGCHVERVDGFDTDQLGTFTREIPRAGTQLQAARAKARKGMALAGSRLGLASEGAFVPDPHLGVLPWDIELLVWIDDEESVEVVGIAQGPAQDCNAVLARVEELDGFAREAGFPEHGLVVRPDGPDDLRARKDFDDAEGLRAAFRWAHALSAQGRVFVESDLRAHRNPTRQALIRQAARDLADRLDSACPACDAPGFWRAAHRAGLPCRACGAPTRLPVAEQWRCVRCAFEEERPRPSGALADPSRCDRCNP